MKKQKILMKNFLRFIGEYKKYVILSPVCVIGEVVMEILIPFIMAKIIDNGVIGGAGMSYIAYVGFIMIIMSIVSLIFGVAAGKFSAIAAVGFAKNIRKTLFDKIQDFSFANIDKFSTASLIIRMTTDVVNIQNAFMMIIRMAVRAPFMLIGATIMAIFTSSKLAFVFLFAIPILAVALYIIMVIVHPRFKAMLEKYDKMNLNVQENLIGIRVVKAFVREDYENKKYKNTADLVRKAQVFAEKLIVLNMPIMQFVVYSCILSVLWFGGNMIIQGNMEIGQLTSFLVYIMQILMSLMMISIVFVMIVISKASRDRILEVLNEESDIKNNGKNAKFKDNSIEFKNVCFSYNNKKDNLVLKNINLSIKSGETLGIIGGTGSGKSTLVQLLPRLYDIFSGSLIIGGNSVKYYDLQNLRDEIAMVLQKNVLFSGTIRENLLWGNEIATNDEIIKVCKISQAHDFITSFPNSYETKLGQGGVNLSGGQKQRICIARALLKKPRILILDDSTSAVDTATEGKIRKALINELPNTTKIIIAQRILSIKDADKIIVLNNGEINGYGTNEELMGNNEIYREIYYSQQNTAME